MARRPFQLLLIVGVFVLFVSGCSPYLQGTGPGTDFSSGETTTSTGSVAEPAWGRQTKISGCHANGPLQDQACTPGDIVQGATREEICTPGYARRTRNVSQSLKNDVYASYGIVKRKPGAYQIDHLVSLQLGGSNDIANLWPEAASPKPGFREKDKVENYLRDQMCNGTMTVKEVQTAIATNWLAVYNSMSPETKDFSSGDSEGEGG